MKRIVPIRKLLWVAGALALLAATAPASYANGNWLSGPGGASPSVGATSGVFKVSPDTTVASRSSVPTRAESRTIAAAAGSGAVVDDPNCGTNTLAANDDGSTEEVPLPFTVNFFGNDYSSLWVNNNGNVTFTQSLSTYTPFEITSTTPPIIAPFLADVDTRGSGSGLVTYGDTTFEGRPAFCVDWPFVGYFAEHTDKLNDFQMILVERGDVAPGNFDIVFNYGQIQWETGDASGGTEGFGGTAPAVGFSNGDGNPSHFFELPGSLVDGAFLDSNPQTALVSNDYGSNVPGRYVFHVTGGAGGTNGGGSNLSRPWPTEGYGYDFANKALSAYLGNSRLALGNVLNTAGLSSTFADWQRAAVGNGGEATLIRELGRAANGGVCFGLSLSGGRLDGEMEPLFDRPERMDSTWASVGSGPSATMKLPEPSTSWPTLYDEEFLKLIADDFVSQYSTEVNTSLQLQHYAYADPTNGVGALRAQLETVLATGSTNYGHLPAGIGTGFAMIDIHTLDPRPGRSGNWVGHEVLAYSMENLNNGGFQIDVWDNRFPGVPYAITVEPDGTWTYDATSGPFFRAVYSLGGAPGYDLGLLAVLPLFDPVGLHFTPHGGGLGSGTLVDTSPGSEVAHLVDGKEANVDIEPVASDLPEERSAEIIDFPSGRGQLTLSGTNLGLDVRGQETAATVAGRGEEHLAVIADQERGSIEASGGAVDLSVTRSGRVVTTSGVTGLTSGADGTVSTTGDSENVAVRVEFEHEGRLDLATLYEGAAPPGGGMTFTPAQIAAAEAAANATTNIMTVTTNSTTLSSLLPTMGSASVGSVRVSGRTVSEQVSCAGASSAMCELTLMLTVTETMKGGKLIAVSASKKKRSKIVKRTVTVGSETVSLTGGQSELVKFALNATGRRLLSTRHKLAAQLTTTEAGTGGHSTVLSRRTVTFKAAGESKHRKKG